MKVIKPIKSYDEMICPKCNSRMKYNATLEKFVCTTCSTSLYVC